MEEIGQFKLCNSIMTNKWFFEKQAKTPYKRDFVAHKEDYVTDSRFFLNERHRNLFKKFLPKFFDYRFEGNKESSKQNNLFEEIKNFKESHEDTRQDLSFSLESMGVNIGQLNRALYEFENLKDYTFPPSQGTKVTKIEPNIPKPSPEQSKKSLPKLVDDFIDKLERYILRNKVRQLFQKTYSFLLLEDPKEATRVTKQKQIAIESVLSKLKILKEKENKTTEDIEKILQDGIKTIVKIFKKTQQIGTSYQLLNDCLINAQKFKDNQNLGIERPCRP